MKKLLIRWINLLKRKGINSKKIVREEMEDKLVKLSEQEKQDEINEIEYMLDMWEFEDGSK